MRYDDCYDAMEKLSSEQILNGCKVFEEHGMKEDVSYRDRCFLANVAGVLINTSYGNAVREALPELTSVEFTEISATHYDRPEVVFLIACEILENRGVKC